MHIIVVTCIPMIQQHLSDLFIDSLQKNHTIHLWDLSPLYGRDEHVTHRVENSLKISSLEQLSDLLSTIPKPALVLTNIMFYSLKKIYQTIHQAGIPIANITKEGLAYYLFASNWRSLNPFYGAIDAAKMAARVVSPVRRLINLWVNKSVKYDYLLANGNFYPEYTHHFYPIHHVKYDEYLQHIDDRPLVEGDYAVFLDTAATTHPFYGLSRHANKKKISSTGYFERLNRFFDRVENETGLKVVIAAHPKADYLPDTFQGRPIHKYQTASLIQHSKLVLSHYSTSVINAVLAEKPLAFLYYPEMFYTMQKYMAIGAIEYGKRLKANIINLDKESKISLTIDQDAYSKFKNRFLINPSTAGRTNEDLVRDFLAGLEHCK